MRFNDSTKTLLQISLLLCVTACAHKEPKPETITLCNSNGCSEQLKDYESFNPAKTSPAEDPNGKIAALEKLATNDPRAAYDLALRLFRGDGVRQDTYRSIKWMRDAAERGDLNAQKALGRLYLTGLGEMGSDPGEAEKWLSITVNRGDTEAANLLQEAIAARQSEQAEYRWHKRWQSVFYNNWYYGYRYNGYWGNSGGYLWY
jgi:TPR repeat protein